MNSKNISIRFILFILDFVLLNIAFFIMNYWKRGTVDLSSNYIKLLILINIIWLFVSILTKKINVHSYRYLSSVVLFARSTIFIIYCVSLLVVMAGMYEYSRIQIFGTCSLFYLLEVLFYSIYYFLTSNNHSSQKKNIDRSVLSKSRISVILLTTDFLFLTLIFFSLNYFKRGTFALYPDYEKLLLLIYGIWFVASLITRKFEKSRFQNYTDATFACIKAGFLMIASMAVIVLAFRLVYFSRLQIFGTFLLLIMVEPLFYRLYFIVSRYGKEGKDIDSVEEVERFIQQEKLSVDIDIDDIRQRLTRPIRTKLQGKYLKEYPKLFNFLDESINLSDIIKAETTIINHTDPVHLRTIDDNPIRLFINLHKINDVRWINRYFLDVHSLLLNGGYFVGKAHTISTHNKWFFKKYPKYFAELIYPIDFIINRMLPKLPVIKRIYFSITKGKGRILSRAELLGRLNFCGFKIIAEKEIDERLFFVVQKLKTPSFDKSPSYGPIVKFKRTGTNGNIVQVYKFRTMHPYSEYLQEYVFEKNNLKEGGKFRDDFRISSWGKLMRKTWIDELPMVYNWFVGDMKLFGVRPLSKQYLDLYPQDLQNLRKKVKPGLIPPYYADMPKTFDDICESERRYIESFLKNPLRTQVGYFGKAVYNIVVKGARSN